MLACLLPPQLTYLVVSRSHGTRLFPVDEADSLRGNVMPGTVVDTQLVAPLKFEFFLNPHAGIQAGAEHGPLWDLRPAGHASSCRRV